MVRRYLINAYQLGYDKINILYNNSHQCNYVQQKLPELLGYEILERTNEGCIVQNIATKIDIDFKSAVKKTFLITNNMIDNIYEAYKKFNKIDLANVPYKDVDINKYTSFCLRAINKEIYTGYTSSQIHTIYHIIITVENIADYYKKLSKLLIKFREDKDILNVILKIKDFFGQNHEFFYKPNKEKMLKSIQMNLNIRRMIKNSFKETKDSKKLLILTLLSRITDTTYHLTSKHLTGVIF